jgi:hypothetical protein
MRLREIQWILRAAKKLSVDSINDRAHGQQTYTTIHNLNALRASLEIVASLDAFRDEAKATLNHEVFRFPHDQVEFSRLQRDELRTNVSSLRARVKDTLAIIDQLLPKESPSSFAYHLPPRHDLDLGRAEAQLERVKEIFEQPLRRLTSTTLRVRGFESGPNVLDELEALLDEPLPTGGNHG